MTLVFPHTSRIQKLAPGLKEMVSLCKPGPEFDWCDGSQAEYDHLCNLLVSNGTFIKINESKRPN
ncbi:MAG: hypothetical protein V9G12_06860, partial [Microthrixaceae bacterium]